MQNNETQIGLVKEWHNPRNEECPHNGDVAFNCNCKRPMVRKPYRTVRVTDNGVGHNTNPKLIIEAYPDGTFAMREYGRRKRFYWNTADLYRHLLRRAAFAYQNAKRKARAGRRKR